MRRFEGLEKGEQGIFPDPASQSVAEGWRAGVAKALEEIANVAVFIASDKASGMTGTTVNLTMGSLDD
jgi:hypothetical protein